MRFMLRCLPRNATACALLVLAPLATYSQDAPTRETHGIVVAGIVIANMDRSVKPGDDFYRYANGDWIKRTEIPPDRSDIGVIDSLIDLSQKRVAGLIDEAAKADAPPGSNARKIADLHHSFMDEAAIEAKGLAPLRPQLDAIAAIRDKHALARALGESLRADVDAPAGRVRGREISVAHSKMTAVDTPLTSSDCAKQVRCPTRRCSV
jgi:predicted metalloendopeptidase